MGTSSARNSSAGIKYIVGSMLAGLCLGLSGCSDASSAKTKTAVRSDVPPSAKLKPQDTYSAQTFASLSENVQTEIRAAYEKCMTDIMAFANEEPNLKLRQLEVDDGRNDCDHQRTSRIRSAKAQQDMKDTTRKITSPD